ncbi:hypothetical protein ABT115_08905 [Streptomyces sp. NPDC001832]|uniref:hypothetical protein n=1 Tax=Streptomyces sp. NPDC001832 TaxID=3154527 RepID=UPI003318561A
MKFTPDLFNNVGRMCAVRGDSSGRVWRVRSAMRGPLGERYYLCRNQATGAFRAVKSDRMSNLY